MINFETGRYVDLNATALAIWEMVQTPQSGDAITEQLLDRFHVSPAECKAAVTTALGDMEKLSLIAPA